MRDGRTKALAAASVTLEEFLASVPDYRPGCLERRAIVHGHCHQKALVGMEPDASRGRRCHGRLLLL